MEVLYITDTILTTMPNEYHQGFRFLNDTLFIQ